MLNNELISNLLPIVQRVMKESESIIIETENGGAIKISTPAPFEEGRPSKKLQPIIINLHEDFSTSEFSERSLSEIREEFESFIRNKSTQFNPRTTNNPNEPHTTDYWVFPPEC